MDDEDEDHYNDLAVAWNFLTKTEQVCEKNKTNTEKRMTILDSGRN